MIAYWWAVFSWAERSRLCGFHTRHCWRRLVYGAINTNIKDTCCSEMLGRNTAWWSLNGYRGYHWQYWSLRPWALQWPSCVWIWGMIWQCSWSYCKENLVTAGWSGSCWFFRTLNITMGHHLRHYTGSSLAAAKTWERHRRSDSWVEFLWLNRTCWHNGGCHVSRTNSTFLGWSKRCFNCGQIVFS